MSNGQEEFDVCNSSALIPEYYAFLKEYQAFALTLSTLEIVLTDVVWTYDTFEYNFEINHRFTKYLKELYRLGSDEHYSFKYFTKSALVTKI